MVDLVPFRALRYDLGRVPDLSRVISQPYDKVDDALRDAYYARHPQHVVRLDKRKDEPGDATGDLKYAAAGAELARWMEQGVLVEDPRPSLYVTHQVYPVAGGRRVRKGVCAMVRLEEAGKGRIHPHEETHAGPKADRLKLLRAASVHFGHIFLLYPDPARDVGAILDAAVAGRAPDLQAVDDFGDEHRAWRVDDAPVIAAIRGLLATREAVIADGHHRYETAVAFRNEARAAGRKGEGGHSPENVLATLVSMDDEGLTCYGTHRVIRDKPPVGPGLIQALKSQFEVREYAWNGNEKAARASLLADLAAEHGKRPAFGLALPSAAHALVAVQDVKATAARVKAPRSEDWRSLDNNILHTLVLEPLLGITPDDTAHERFVDYVRSADEAVERVLSGRAVAAFLVNPVTMEQIRRVVGHGERFPQKSTDFYPKMITGLLMARLHWTS